MRSSSSGFRGKRSLCAAVATAAILLAGCSEDPGLQERLSRLQAEMQEKDRQLQESQSALEKTKSELKSARAASASKPVVSATPAATPQFLSREQVEESYAAASKAMQKRVASELHNYSVENCTQFPVMMPTDDYPYHSRVALSFRSDNGRSYRLEFPVSADADGKWTFPNSVDIAGALAESSQQDQGTSTARNPTTAAPTSSPRVALNNSTPSTATNRASAQGTPELAPGQTATETRVIDWGGGHAPGNKRPTPSPAANNSLPSGQQPTPAREAQQPTPPQSKAPAQAMQSDKDVTIHW